VFGLSLLCSALAAVAAALGIALWRSRRERVAALALLGAQELPLTAAIDRELRQLVPRDELAATLFSREAILEAAPWPVLIADADRRIVRMNRGAAAAFPGVPLGARLDEAIPALAAPLAAVLTGPPVHTVEVVVDSPTRHIYEAHLRSHPDGERRSAVAVLVDVTSAVDFREARRLFSAAASHELRTPLARILGLAETLALPQSQAERDALVAQTEAEVDNMRLLIDEMLLLAALDRGEISAAGASSDAALIAEQVVADRAARRVGRGRALSVEATRGLIVPVAARLLEVVIGNVVDNALSHGGEGAAVSVTVRGLAGEVEIAVTDTGLGIAPQHLPHVFERFYRGDASRAGPGTGLGLAVVKHVVEVHGGRVSADSAPGQGTTVRIVLPEPPVTSAP
jgi:two-component system, OmpR family, phosphate regulon sensor histidine kinase PhoR